MSIPVIRTGDRVEVTEKQALGTVRYVGQTQFQPGKWIGVELDVPKEKNNGTVQGKLYFACPDNHGVFVRPSQVQVVEKKATATSGIRKPGATMTSSTEQTNTDTESAGSISRESSSSGLSELKSSSHSKIPGFAMKNSKSSERLKGSSEALTRSTEKLKNSPSASKEKLTNLTVESAKPPPSRLQKPSQKSDGGKGQASSQEGSGLRAPLQKRMSVADHVAQIKEGNVEVDSGALRADFRLKGRARTSIDLKNPDQVSGKGKKSSSYTPTPTRKSTNLQAPRTTGHFSQVSDCKLDDVKLPTTTPTFTCSEESKACSPKSAKLKDISTKLEPPLICIQNDAVVDRGAVTMSTLDCVEGNKESVVEQSKCEGIVSWMPATGFHIPGGLELGAELEYLRSECKDLWEKLKHCGLNDQKISRNSIAWADHFSFACWCIKC